jgi:ATP-dependent Lon protease
VALPEGVIALVPMRNVVLFPHVLVPITVSRAKSVAAVAHALQSGSALGIVLQRDPQVHVDASDLDAILGPPKFEHEIAQRSSIPAVATGLA